MEALPERGIDRSRKQVRTRSATVADDVRRLVERLDGLDDLRAARLSRARRLLATGQLDTHEVHRETARRMLGL